jgi:hypothetical protein
MKTISGFARRQYFHGFSIASWVEIAVVEQVLLRAAAEHINPAADFATPR